MIFEIRINWNFVISEEFAEQDGEIMCMLVSKGAASKYQSSLFYCFFHYSVIQLEFSSRTPRPVVVEPMEQFDDEDGLPEKLMQKTQQYHK